MYVVLVYFQPFQRSSHLKCALQPNITKKSLKPFIGTNINNLERP